MVKCFISGDENRLLAPSHIYWRNEKNVFEKQLLDMKKCKSVTSVKKQ